MNVVQQHKVNEDAHLRSVRSMWLINVVNGWMCCVVNVIMCEREDHDHSLVYKVLLS